jgi:hypothetical protein
VNRANVCLLVGAHALDCAYTYSSAETRSNGTFRTPTDTTSDGKNVYPPNIDCIFQFRARVGQVVWVDWDTFHLEAPMISNNQ